MDTESNNDGEDEREETVSDEERPESERRGISLGFALRPVADLLRGVVDVGISRPGGEPRPDPDERSRREGAPARRRSSETPAAGRTAAGYHVETYRYEDETVIVADLPGVREDELSVGLAERSNAVVVSVRGRVVSRIPLPWDAVEVADVWFYNEVLNVRVRPADGGDGVGDGEE